MGGPEGGEVYCREQASEGVVEEAQYVEEEVQRREQDGGDIWEREWWRFWFGGSAWSFVRLRSPGIGSRAGLGMCKASAITGRHFADRVLVLAANRVLKVLCCRYAYIHAAIGVWVLVASRVLISHMLRSQAPAACGGFEPVSLYMIAPSPSQF